MIKISLAIFFLFVSMTCLSQERTVESFTFEDTNIEYTRIDYSEYGISHFFITMYDAKSGLGSIVDVAEKCLNKKSRIYHTLYFFLEIPEEIKNQEMKEKLFSEFVKHLSVVEKLNEFNLYLNFDFDYSNLYQEEVLVNKNLNEVDRIYLAISGNYICRGLWIR